MTIRLRGDLTDLVSDLRRMPGIATRDARRVVREGIRLGAREARDNARSTAGAHGVHYPKAMTSEMTYEGYGLIAGEWGPDVAFPQGGMSFEHGSRNQPAHLDVARSADTVVPAFHGEMSRILDGLFWP